jgi:FtsZ-binding cell division protein ZapB
MKIYTLFPLIALSGCQTTQPIAVDIAPLSAQIERLTEANLKLDRLNHDLDLANGQLKEANDRLLSQIRADAEAGRAANGKGWLAFEGYVWGQQILRLSDVTPDAPTEARWAEAATLYQAGGESAMQSVIADLQGDAAETNQTLGELRESVESLTAQRDAANEAASLATIELERVRGETASLVEQARISERDALQKQAREFRLKAANWAGTAAGAVSLACIAGLFFLPASKGKLLRGAVAGAAVSVLAFAFAEWSASPWFLWIAGGLALTIVAGWIAWEVRQDLRREAERKRIAALEMTAPAIIRRSMRPTMRLTRNIKHGLMLRF